MSGDNHSEDIQECDRRSHWRLVKEGTHKKEVIGLKMKYFFLSKLHTAKLSPFDLLGSYEMDVDMR